MRREWYCLPIQELRRQDVLNRYVQVLSPTFFGVSKINVGSRLVGLGIYLTRCPRRNTWFMGYQRMRQRRIKISRRNRDCSIICWAIRRVNCWRLWVRRRKGIKRWGAVGLLAKVGLLRMCNWERVPETVFPKRWGDWESRHKRPYILDTYDWAVFLIGVFLEWFSTAHIQTIHNL